MKKTIVAIFGVLILGLAGCNNKKVSIDELQSVKSEIIEYFQTYGIDVYDNYAFHYVDDENKVVVVGLFR